jgi:16S rRNA (adenine1518-N6/adenine1519-N6)-dimethyltransferase
MDQHVIRSIIEHVGAKEGDHVIEIGPGQGALTESLASSGCHLEVIEIDRDLSRLLKVKFPDLKIHIHDVLKMDFDSAFQNHRLRIVGNLPYNISTPLLFRLFRHTSRIKDMHFMLQLEVVDRMNAEPSTSNYGRLSIMTQYHCDTEKLFKVPPEAFSPRPKVNSAVIRLTPRIDKPEVDPVVLEELLTNTFSFRRKTLRNAMKKYLTPADLEQLGIDSGLRPENLDINQFVKCANAISAKSVLKRSAPKLPEDKLT